MKLFTPIQNWWQSRAGHEKSTAVVTLSILFLYLFWRLCLASAVGIASTASSEQALLDSQLQKMQSLQSQVQLIQMRPKMGTEQATLALEALTKQHFGPAAQMQLAGDQVTVVFKNVPSNAVSQWLVQTRVKANVLPNEAHLQRNGALPIATNAVTSAPAGAAWDGVVVLNLRERP